MSVVFDLRMQRRLRGLSQHQLADELGLHRDTISRLERAEGEPHPANAKRVADYFEISVAQLLGMEPTPDPLRVQPTAAVSR